MTGVLRWVLLPVFVYIGIGLCLFSYEVVVSIPPVVCSAVLQATTLLSLVIAVRCGGLTVTPTHAQAVTLLYEVKEGERVDGLPNPLLGIVAIGESSDGGHLYAAAREGNVLSHYIRDLDGRLTFQAVYGDDPSEGDLRGVYIVRVSADGRNVYAVGESGRILVFRREQTDGRLSLVAEDESHLPGAMSDFIVSPDGRNAYASVVSVGADDPPGLVSFTRDAQSGRLLFLNGLEVIGDFGGQAHSHLQFTPSGVHLYVRSLNSARDNWHRIMLLQRDPETGALLSASEAASGSADFLFRFSADSRYAYGISNPSRYLWGAVVAVHRLAGERLDLVSNFSFYQSHVSGLVASADGRHVYVGVDTGTSRLHLFRNDFGTLSPLDTLDVTSDRPRVSHSGGHLFHLSPDDRYFSVLQPDKNAIAIYERDRGTGALHLVDVEREEEPLVTGLKSPRDVDVRADGRFVYVLDSNALSVFRREAETGVPHFVEAVPLHLADGRSIRASRLALSPDGRHVYVTGGERTLLVFAIDTAMGRLALLQELTSDSHEIGDLGIEVSPNGRQVLTGTHRGGSEKKHSIVVFDRDVESGRLTFRQAVPDGAFTTTEMAISQDGQNVYAVGGGGWVSGELRVYLRQPDGTYTFAQYFDWAEDVEISADGRYVYTVSGNMTGIGNERLTVYRRVPENGLLSVVMSLPVLPGSANLEISPDGERVYVESSVFSRDPESGRVALLSDPHESQPVFTAAAISADARHLYTVDGHSRLLVYGTGRTTVGAENLWELPDPLGELSVYPNPFREFTTVELYLSAGGDVEVAIYDLLGRRLQVLHRGSLPPGAHRLMLVVPGLSSGTYLVRLSGTGISAARPIVVRD